MAVKYRREGLRQRAAGSHGMFDRVPRRTLNQKQRLLIIYIGILVFCGMMLASHLMGLGITANDSGPATGIGRVTAKRIAEGPDPQYFVSVSVPVASESGDAPVTLIGEAQVPKASYDSVEVGTPLTVVYERSGPDSLFVVGLSQVETPPEPVIELHTPDPTP